MLVTKQIEIDMGHRVPNHKSKCRNLHGHRYKIEVGVDDKIQSSQGKSDEGMVIDYSDFKELIMVIDRVYDHSFTIYSNDPLVKYFRDFKDGLDLKINIVDFIPTAENLAKYWFEKLKVILEPIKIKHVKVWETPTSTATYQE